MKKESIIFDEKVINLIYKKVKFARLKISRDGIISMSLPLRYPKKLVLQMLLTHQIWLNEKLKLIKTTALKENQIRLLGQIYSLKFDDSIKSVQINELTITSPNLAKFSKFKKEFAKELFQKHIDKFSPLINKPINQLKVRSMTTRWGSCNSIKGYINLNLNLIEKDEYLIEYVVLHELTHLIYPHHQKSFYEFIAKVMPDFKERERALRG